MTRDASLQMPMKLKSVIGLVTLTMVICNFFDEEIARRNLQHRKCNSISELLADELNEEGTKSLRRVTFNPKSLYERLLEYGIEDPCLTEFPPQIQEVIADEQTIKDMTEPTFEVVAEDDDEEFLAQEIDGIVDIAPQNDNIPLDSGERDLIENFAPQDYNIGGTVGGSLEPDVGHDGTIAYTVPLTGCPEWYEPTVDTNGEPPLAADLYEASAILKSEVCETTETAASSRRLGMTRKLVALKDQTSAAVMDYSMHALIHPMTTECPVEGADAGNTYDRVTLMKSLDYEVEIVGHPINERDLEEAQQYYILENVENDVGVRDSTKLHIWRMTSHPAVVLMTYKTILQHSLDEEIDALLADDNLKGMYVLNAPDPQTGGAGVDTGLLIIKPDLEEFDRIVSTYIHTPYLEGSGWNGQGFNNFKGHLGISGFLAYYFATNPGCQQLDRCMYAHDADELCNQQQEVEGCKAFKMDKDVCGNPRDCPYDHPNWNKKRKEACLTVHRKYYDYRYKFEEKYFNKNKKQERVGLFKPKSFLGYCTGAGKEKHLSMVGEIIPKQDWQTTCHPDGCPPGSFLKPDCSCTTYGEDPCNACPANTYCQRTPSLICIDCNCGFCDSSGTACCDFNGVNNCKGGPGDNKNCALQNDFFPAFSGSGNTCGGVEISRTAVPNGCGCKPNSVTPCTYSKEWGNVKDKCFICTAADLANRECASCKECIRSCGKSSCFDKALTEDDYVKCLSSTKDETCRANCHEQCMFK